MEGTYGYLALIRQKIEFSCTQNIPTYNLLIPTYVRSLQGRKGHFFSFLPKNQMGHYISPDQKVPLHNKKVYYTTIMFDKESSHRLYTFLFFLLVLLCLPFSSYFFYYSAGWIMPRKLIWLTVKQLERENETEKRRRRRRRKRRRDIAFHTVMDFFGQLLLLCLLQLKFVGKTHPCHNLY